MAQSVIKHFLRDTRLRLRVAESFEDALPLLDEQASLLICDHMIQGKFGSDFVAMLRLQGQALPVILLTSDTSDAAREAYLRAEVSTFLTKPIDQNTLLRALAEFLSPDKDIGGSVTSLPRNHPNTPMVDRFVKEVRAQADEIEKAIQDQNYEHTRNVVLQIAGVAPIMGFPKLAQIAQAADRALSSSMSLEESKSQLRQLVRICREVRRSAA
jgi:CheY-like chemotaxis protein